MKVETTQCSLAECVEVEDIGGDWFRIRSTTTRKVNIAITGAELRAFLLQVKAGQFDEIAGLEPELEPFAPWPYRPYLTPEVQ